MLKSNFNAALLLGLLLLGAVPLAGLRAAEKPSDDASASSVGDEDIDIIIGGQPTKGRVVLPPTEGAFKFKLHETGQVCEFRWKDLAEYERKRVQKLYGMAIEDGRQVFGDKITGIVFKLKSGKSIEGLPIPDRDQAGYKALKTPTAPLLLIPIGEIVSEEPFEKYESDFYSPLEVYERKLLEKPPGSDDAAAHLSMAQFAAGIGLYNKAVEHLEQAGIIDPRTIERNQDFRMACVQKLADQQSQELFDLMVREMRAGDFLSAKDRIQTLERSFKNSPLKSRWDSLRPLVEEGGKTEINKNIVQLSYRLANDMVQRKLATRMRIDDKGNKIDVKPGKQITTRKGNIFRGVLVSIGGAPADTTDDYEKNDPSAKAPALSGAPAAPKGLDAGDVTLKMGDTTITIAGNEILSILDVDLSEAKLTAEATYDELKEYVTDLSSPSGLKQEMCKRISQIVKIPAADVQKIFDNRLVKEGTYKNETLTMTKNYASLHDASWGIGSWLRPGSKVLPYVKPPQNPGQNGGNGYGGGQGGGGQGGTGGGVGNRGGRGGVNGGGGTNVANGNNGRNGRNGRNGPNGNQNNQDDDETVDSTDDPVFWWKYQSPELKLQILRAMMAEKVFKLQSITNVACPHCAAKGTMNVTAVGGNDLAQRCNMCRGLGVYFKIQYH